MKDNIILIGFMGSGKTSVGIKLARSIEYQFLDTDAYIEAQYGGSISKIFATEGEEKFRSLETECLRQLKENLKGYVISTGGGMPMLEENSKLLREIGQVVFLKTSKEVIYERLKEDKTRPLLQGENPIQKIEKLLALRTPIYEATANNVIVTDGVSFYQIIKDIMDVVMD
jgi:shikimate dehydrogenase/shikimate kinase